MMRALLTMIVHLSLLGGLLLSCGSDPSPPEPESEAKGREALIEAMRSYPTLFEVQTALVTKTCSPNPGVCHNSRETPELHTLGSLVSQIDAPCNVRHPNPVDGWNACERIGDRLTIGELTSEIAWHERIGPGEWTFLLRDAAPSVDGGFRIVSSDGALVFEPPTGWVVTVQPGSAPEQVKVVAEGEPDRLALVDSVFETVVVGDPNRDGVFGANTGEADRARIIAPGSLDRSYLWRRLIGDVPGSRMPLANGPVTDAQYYSLGCWIESLRPDSFDPDGPIDYEACSFYPDPPSFTEE